MITKFVGRLLLALAIVASADARLVKKWSHQELAKKASTIAIIQAVDTKKTDLPWRGFQGLLTTFKIHLVMKGEVDLAKPFVVVHYTYPQGMTEFNGAQFVRFPIGPVKREVEYLKDGKREGYNLSRSHVPLYLVYLKKREDGRYEPVTGHYDAYPPFKEVTDWIPM